MKEIHFSTKAKKDLKRYRSDLNKMKALYEVMNLLKNDSILPDRYKAHMLSGNYKDCMECHVGNDFLLIWFDIEQKIIDILRIGTHSELFGK